MRNWKALDLKWSWNGDLVIGHSSDLEDTRRAAVDSFVQEVQTRVRSSLGDWQMHPSLGADLPDLIGEPNEPRVAEEGKVRIIASLVRDSFCDTNKISIRFMPVDIHTIFYDVSIVLPGLSEESALRFSLIFDSNESEVVFL